MKVRVDGTLCQGHTLCSISAPDVFLLRDEDGHAYVESEEVPPDRQEAVRRAAAGCPEGAIVIEDDAYAAGS